MELSKLSVEEFTTALASKSPVPGGGGAAALAGALGMALGSMVGALTIGKKKYAAVEGDIAVLMQKAESLRRKLCDCIQKDADAFAPLAAVYSMPKDAPDRNAVMEQCLRDAAAVPLEIMHLSAEAIDLLVEFAEKGSTLAVSDAASGAALCRAAIQSGAVNVRVNTALMHDREYAECIDREANSLMIKYTAESDKIFTMVLEEISV